MLKEGRSNYQDEFKIFLKENLRYVDYFKPISKETIEELSYHLKLENFEAGDIIFRAGNKVDKLYFVIEGEIDIIVKVGKKEATLDTLYQLCNIGEYGILGEYTHTFTAKSKDNSTLAYITKDSLHTVNNKVDDLHREIEI